MGYINNNSITVDAIITKRGRELLSKGHDFFKITKFALSDDEIDYRLWDEAHPSGSNYYGYAIEQMPLLEPIPDETQVMRYKLVTLDKSTTRIPVVTVSPTASTLIAGNKIDIEPGTLITSTGVSFNQTLGYTCILHNSDAATLYAIESNLSVPGKNPPVQLTPSQPGAGIFLSDSELAKSVWVTGFKFRLVAKQITTGINTIVTVIGNESGGSAVMTLTVDPLVL